MHFNRTLLSLIGVCLFGASHAVASTPASRPLPTDRGRVVVDRSLGYPRLLTDKGTLIRAVALAWDSDKAAIKLSDVPSQDTLNVLAQTYGMNAVHLYLEKYNTNPNGSLQAGTNQPACDLLVDRCSKAGLYLVITIGNGNVPNLNCFFPSIEFCRNFWRFYAPHYKDRTNVIYEIQNEPGPEVSNIKEIMAAQDRATTPHPIPWNNKASVGDWTEKQYADEVELYKIIRAGAPESHVMLFSWCDFDNAVKARECVDYATRHGVDWTKSSAAFHGYVEAGMLSPTVDQFLYSPSNPAALTCTEVPQDENTATDIKLFERHTIGWCLFNWVGNPGNCLDDMKKDFDAKGTAWAPEQGSWPDTGGLPLGSVISLKSVANGKYVLADDDGEALLSSTGNKPSDHSRYLVVNMASEGAGMVGLQSIASHRYICADFAADGDKPDAAGDAPLIADKLGPKTWESFRWEWFDKRKGTFALQSAFNKKYVRLGPSSDTLWASAPGAPGPDSVLQAE